MLPLLSRRVTVDSREFAVSIEKAGTLAPRTLEAPPIRSDLCIRSTAVDGSGGRVVCAAPPSRKLTPAHAHDATAHSPAVTVNQNIRMVIPASSAPDDSREPVAI